MITRGILLAGYLFLFAGQFNYRYFTIANFYVYNGNGNLSNGAQLQKTNRIAATAVAPVATGQHSITLHDNSQRPSHLGIDKRYQAIHGIRIPQIRAPGIAYTAVVKTRFHTQTSVFLSVSLPTNALRGPPCA